MEAHRRDREKKQGMCRCNEKMEEWEDGKMEKSGKESPHDVLELYDGHGSTFYYVDQIGFVQIPFEGAEPGMESCLEM